MGGRSRAAAEILAGRGFSEVYSLAGGMRAWRGAAARGPESSGLSLLAGGETAAGMLAAAHGLELGLRDLYREAAQRETEATAARLLENLAAIEDRHVQRAAALFRQAEPTAEEREAFEQGSRDGLLEGGFTAGDVLDNYLAPDQGSAPVLDTAMMLEAQGLDLYLRMAQSADIPGARQALWDIAQEEKAHLRALGELRDSLEE